MYSYRVVRSICNISSNVEIAYPDQEDGEDHLADGLEGLIEGYNERLPPSRLLFVCPEGFENTVATAYLARREQFEERLVPTTHVAVAPYDIAGRLKGDKVVELRAEACRWAITDNFLEDVARQGVADLFDQSNTVLQAPHGYVFRKPSKSEKEIFIRAGNILREPGCLAVFNHLILRRLPPQSRIVYIDSFTILSFALSLKSVVAHFRRVGVSVPELTVKNFHSYDIDPELRLPNEENYVVLISASTSGDLARRLCDQNKADRTRIIHLLGVGTAGKDDEFRKSCVYFAQPPIRFDSKEGVRGSKSIIEIGTEEFLVAQGTPRPVRIGVDHVDRKGRAELSEPFYREALRFHEAGGGRTGSYAPFTVSDEFTDGDVPVARWIAEELVHELPASVGTLVPVGGAMAVRVAEWLQQSLGRSVTIVELSRIETSGGRVDKSRSVVVVAYQDPGLDDVNRAAVALRKIGDIHRHYVVCYAFPPTVAGHDRLKANLLMGPRGPNDFGWSQHLAMPVGASRLHGSLVERRRRFTARNLNASGGGLNCEVEATLLRWGTGQSVAPNDLFLPCTSGNLLGLRHGSIFFDTEKASCISQVAVHAMVSAALQRAREPVSPSGRPLRTEFTFDDNPFVRSVLDPGMFARFSDGVLQASLLHATHPWELDYSATQALSAQFRSACSSVFDSHTDPVGDAAFEFVNALGKV